MGAAGELTETFAGLASDSAGINAHCVKGQEVPTVGNPGILKLPHKFAHCVIDSKSLLKSVLKAAMHALSLKENCKENEENEEARACPRNIIRVVATLTEIGEYFAGAFGHCSMPTNHD